MQRYFVNNREKEKFVLSSDDSHHVKNVMRNTLGDRIEVIFQKKFYVCEIIALTPLVCCQIIEEITTDTEEMPYVTIAQSLVKEQKMDYILQKSCELGVSEVIPYAAERSVVKLQNVDAKAEKRGLRWHKILKEASEQCKRVDIPKINQVSSIEDIIALDYDVKLICTVNNKTTMIKKVLSNITKGDRIIIVIGPEGGFSSLEESVFMQHGFQPVSLGTRVLRTETASSYVLSVINYELMR